MPGDGIHSDTPLRVEKTDSSPSMAVAGCRCFSVALFLLSWQLGSSAPPWTTTSETPPPSNTPCELLLSIEAPKSVLQPNGSLWDPEGRIMYPRGTFWLWEGEGVEKKPIYRVCPCKLEGRPCIRKCCLLGETMSEKAECVPNVHPFVFNVTQGNDTTEVEGTTHFALLYGNPCSHGRYMLDPFTHDIDEFYIKKTDGHLVVPFENYTEQGPEDFCIDYFPEKDYHLPLLCFPPNDDELTNQLIYTMYPVGMLVSIPFLLVTFLVYALIPELRNLHGKSLMCHVSSLLTAYTFLAVVQLGGTSLNDATCITSAFIIEFSFLATFFWLNIMCFDICLTFSGFRSLRGSLRERERKKFLIYSLYAWGCPLIILIICLIMDFVPGIPDSYLKPRFGKFKCWFATKLDALAYFFGPIGLLVLCNVVLFIITAVKILRLKKETAVLKRGDSRRSDDTDDRTRFNLYLKLLIVMGVNWIMELISWAVGGPEYLWYVTDVGNTLQGFFIFLIFVWKDKIRNILLQKLCPSFASRRPLDGSSWYNWRSNRAISPTKSSSLASTVASNVSSNPNNEFVKLKPLLNTSKVFKANNLKG